MRRLAFLAACCLAPPLAFRPTSSCQQPLTSKDRHFPFKQGTNKSPLPRTAVKSALVRCVFHFIYPPPIHYERPHLKMPTQPGKYT